MRYCNVVYLFHSLHVEFTFDRMTTPASNALVPDYYNIITRQKIKCEFPAVVCHISRSMIAEILLNNPKRTSSFTKNNFSIKNCSTKNIQNYIAFFFFLNLYFVLYSFKSCLQLYLFQFTLYFFSFKYPNLTLNEPSLLLQEIYHSFFSPSFQSKVQKNKFLENNNILVLCVFRFYFINIIIKKQLLLKLAM